ncbi:uncharacterized protein LOC129321978 [Prosopis cineraria]|uniref:uncharacterized protein LOC129321978 n=1 Tax=Prosopis cineraria TaxID=364024 RepID=UPI0024102195|nr:uncharacterized protein LOC129321978 [Prosopis cineraria]
MDRGAVFVNAKDTYSYFTWEVRYGTASPLGILINGQFPGPNIDAVTNDNIILNIINKLDEPFLIAWNDIKQRRTSWQDGVLGNNSPIPPNSNWTYKFQLKDQIGTYNYFFSTKLHRVAGGFGAFNIDQRSMSLRRQLDAGKPLPFPDVLPINGQKNSAVFTGEKARPNPQGSFHYGTIPVVRTKFNLKTIKNNPPPPGTPAKLGVSVVVGLALQDFVEIIFLNNETTVQPWHMDGSSFYVVGRYLGEELYLRVWNNEKSLFTEICPPPNLLFRGKARHLHYYEWVTVKYSEICTSFGISRSLYEKKC